MKWYTPNGKKFFDVSRTACREIQSTLEECALISCTSMGTYSTNGLMSYLIPDITHATHEADHVTCQESTCSSRLTEQVKKHIYLRSLKEHSSPRPDALHSGCRQETLAQHLHCSQNCDAVTSASWPCLALPLLVHAVACTFLLGPQSTGPWAPQMSQIPRLHQHHQGTECAAMIAQPGRHRPAHRYMCPAPKVLVYRCLDQCDTVPMAAHTHAGTTCSSRLSSTTAISHSSKYVKQSYSAQA